MGQAYAAVAECDRPRHEVYVLTDLARSAWDLDQPAEGLDKVEQGQDRACKTYVLRLDAQGRPATSRSSRPSRRRASPPRGSRWRSGPGSGRSGPATTPGRRVLARRRHEGREAGRAPGQRRGRGHASRPPRLDAAARSTRASSGSAARPTRSTFDDARYFTFKVQPATKVLIVSDLADRRRFRRRRDRPRPRRSRPARPGLPGRAGSRPAEFLGQGRRPRPSGTRASSSQRRRQLDDADWGLLSGLRPRGGRAGRRPGRRLADADELQGHDPPARSCPRRLDARSTPPRRPTTFGKVADFTHPLFSGIPRSSTRCSAQVPVYRYWARQAATRGRGVLLLLRRQGPRPGRAGLQGAEDRPRPALDHPAVAPRPTPTRRDAWNEFPLADSAGRSST